MLFAYSRFPRPDGALTLSDIRPGVTFYEVNGTIYGGTVDEKYKKLITSNVGKYRDSALYPDSFKSDDSMGDYLVFHSVYCNSPFGGEVILDKEFVNSHAVNERTRNNDNFIFSDLNKAKAYALWVQNYWLDHSELEDSIREYHNSFDYEYIYTDHED